MKKTILLLSSLLLLAGCTSSNQTTVEETVLTEVQGLGVTSFGTAVSEMAMDTYNYVLMTLRNNAEGTQAKNIKVSLQNVEPFTIYECGEEHNASDLREVMCNQFYNDYRQPYKTHFVDRMRPNEELQFFWNVKAPKKQELVNMRYDHRMYYLLEYDYASTTTQTIFCISQAEYLARSQSGGIQVSSQTTSSPGEIKFTSTTQQPIIYTENDANGATFTLSFQVQNTGEGIAKPAKKVIIALKKPASGSGGINYVNPEEYDWHTYSSLSTAAAKTTGRTAEEQLKADIYTEFNNRFTSLEFPELTEGIKNNDLVIKVLQSDQINQPYLITLPLWLNTVGVFEPQKILTFTVYVSYTYQKESSTVINVYPIR